MVTNERDLLVHVHNEDEVQMKTEEIKALGLQVTGRMYVVPVLFVYGDPCRLEGVTGITVRPQRQMGTTK